LLANSGASQEDTLLKSIKYVAIALGANAGINPGINSGLKDTKEEAIKWGEENLKKNLQTPAMVVATVDTVLERVTSPIKSRELAPHQDDLVVIPKTNGEYVPGRDFPGPKNGPQMDNIFDE
jgi:hypothetical protein